MLTAEHYRNRVLYYSRIEAKLSPVREEPSAEPWNSLLPYVVHGDTMEQLAAHARSLEAHGDLQEARERWLACLPFLPPKSKQAEWIRDHAQQLEVGRMRRNRRKPIPRVQGPSGQSGWDRWLPSR